VLRATSVLHGAGMGLERACWERWRPQVVVQRLTLVACERSTVCRVQEAATNERIVLVSPSSELNANESTRIDTAGIIT
jgi:hypothetical protein